MNTDMVAARIVLALSLWARHPQESEDENAETLADIGFIRDRYEHYKRKEGFSAGARMAETEFVKRVLEEALKPA